MKRDWDLIREILLAVEASGPGESVNLHSFEEGIRPEVSYNVQLLEEVGFVNASISKQVGKVPALDFTIYKIRWEGHDFLDAVRNDTNWNKTKNLISSKGGNMTFEVIKSVAIELARKAILGADA